MNISENPTLYIVHTPIGTLGDLSERARQILAEVDMIICEDTRHTGKLLSHFGIKNQLVSLHLNNEKQHSQIVIQKILDSKTKTAAIVSDAGAPALSDPGSLFICKAHEHNFKILNVPGPSSLTSAIASCGFIQPRIIFSGFLSKKPSAIQREFERWKNISPCICVAFESPNRILKTLTYMSSFFGDEILVCVSREISKAFEEHVRDKLGRVIQHFSAIPVIRGEFVICVNLESERNSKAKEVD